MSQSVNTSQQQSRTVPTNVYGILLLGVLSISFAPILIRLAQGDGVPSLLIAGSRLVLAAIFLTPLTIRRYWQHVRTLTARDFGLAVLAGFALALHFTSWVTSLEYTSVLISVVFVTSSPLWVAMLEFIFLRSKLPRLVVVGLLIAIGGGLLIGFAGSMVDEATVAVNRQRELIGGGLSLVGAIAMAIYLIIGRNLQGGAKLPIIPYIWLVYGTAGIILSLGIALSRIPLTGYPTSAYFWLVVMAIFPQLVGHSSLNYAVGYLPATIVSMATQLEPIGSAILAYFLFAELPLPLQIVGSSIIIAGVTLANIANRKRKPIPNEAS